MSSILARKYQKYGYVYMEPFEPGELVNQSDES